jgi:hypothetical protein
MQAVKAIYDGKVIHPIDSAPVAGMTEVLVIFPTDTKTHTPEDARKRLKGAGRGEFLVDKLLKARSEDIEIERKNIYP